MKWEYNIDPIQINEKRAATRILNNAASEGWEVVGVVPLPVEDKKVWAYIIYKRQLDS